jgi:co-chaperonin GroES (HSP10)
MNIRPLHDRVLVKRLEEDIIKKRKKSRREPEGLSSKESKKRQQSDVKNIGESARQRTHAALAAWASTCWPTR